MGQGPDPQRCARTGGLDALLADARRDSAEFPVALANHGPMLLAILDRLGASEGRLRDALARYRAANHLVAVPPRVGTVTRATWTHHLGDRAREGDFRVFFASEVAAGGLEGTVRRFLPPLLPGMAGSALHPLMRLAYGILRRDPAEVAVALAYWASCFLPLPPAAGAAPDTDDPAAVLARAGALPCLRALPVHEGLLWHGIRTAAAKPAFAPVVDWLRIGPDSLRRVAATSLALFAGTMDFAALHALTGTHWVRIVHGVCPDPLLIRHFWQAVAALVPVIGFPDLPSDRELGGWRARPCPPWSVITAAALGSDDEHDISLVFSAREEEAVYGDPLYRVVAARRMGLIA